ncbi:Periplasmic dipeptide transport protein precursor [Pelotomaculum schinkii]|uniref:Periplasmic dipeptide transport protein n=1 Tax=Pelotomaculum schinkii TaxID=78350 RepID=A0A4Y7RCN3_9FIRM|nr:ABC transporter substrate-binding protein [Pelotomaculum schinkii]TEB06483.1 Periplasmic dipeptide transport protein precursor [Pelotomaculum schinkii]
MLLRLKILSIFLLLLLPVYLVFNSSAVQVTGRLLGWPSGTIVYAREQDSTTLDPALAQEEESYKVISNIFEGLVRFKPGTNEIEPCLAETWRVSSDGLVWTFYLRRNVKFHDDTPFNSEAVRFSIERQLSPQSPERATYASFIFGMVDKVQCPDPYTVKFLLKYPYAPFLNNLAMPNAAPIVSPSAASTLGEKFGEYPVGTGPFCFHSWQKNKNIVLRANKDYWGNPPEYGSLVFKVINNSRLRALALKVALVDIIDGITPADARFLQEKNCPVYQTPGLDLGYLGFFTHKKPFDNLAVRRAFSMAIDRSHINSVIFKGACVEANGPLPPGVLGYDPGTRAIPYDPSGAKELLAQSGYSSGMKFTLITYTNTRPYNPAGGEKLAAAIKADLATIGIETEIKAYPWQQYKEALLKSEGDAYLYGWISDNGDPDNFLYTLLSSSQIESGLNTSRYKNSEADQLFIRAQQEPDPGLREQLYKKAEKIIVEEAPWFFLNHSLKFAATSPGLEGFTLNSNGTTQLSRLKKNR